MTILNFFLLIGLVFLAIILPRSGDAQRRGHQAIEWNYGPDLPLARGGYFAAWYNKGLWIAGGSYWRDGKKQWTAETNFYNPKTGEWSTLDPIPEAIGYGVTARIGRDLYLLGGTDKDGVMNRKILRYHNKTWSTVGRSPEGFIYPAFASVGNRIFVFGGSTSATDVTKAGNAAWAYDVTKKSWSKLDPIPGSPRQIFSAVAVRHSIYVFGGVTQAVGEKFHNLDDAFRFDTKTGTWAVLHKLPRPMRAFWAGTDGKHIYLFGGYDQSGLDTVYQYDPKSDSYKLVSTLPQPLMDTKFIFNDGRFYGASGEDKLASRFPRMVIGTIDE